MTAGTGRVAAAILAGGRARRMGGAVKPLLVVGPHAAPASGHAGGAPTGARRILDRQLDLLQPLFGAVALVVADERARTEFVGLGLVGRPGVDVICDRPGPGLGPLAGLDAALAWLPSGFDSVVCVGGDMPALDANLLRAVRDTGPGSGAVVPRWSRGMEPLCARYARALGVRTAAALASGVRALHRFVEQVATTEEVTFIEEPRLRALDPDLRSFINVNTPEDLARWRVP